MITINVDVDNGKDVIQGWESCNTNVEQNHQPFAIDNINSSELKGTKWKYMMGVTGRCPKGVSLKRAYKLPKIIQKLRTNDHKVQWSSMSPSELHNFVHYLERVI